VFEKLSQYQTHKIVVKLASNIKLFW